MSGLFTGLAEVRAGGRGWLWLLVTPWLSGDFRGVREGSAETIRRYRKRQPLLFRGGFPPIAPANIPGVSPRSAPDLGDRAAGGGRDKADATRRTRQGGRDGASVTGRA